MANQEQLEILRQGVEVWNEWRVEHPDERPDFSEVDFRNAILKEGNLSRAILKGANLQWVNLSGADLTAADLSGANLIGAILCEVNTGGKIRSGADLTEANLSGADLRGAYLFGANLSRANLSDAELSNIKGQRVNLNGAELNRANLKEANLIGADFNKANLNRVDLSAAILGRADLSGIDLSGANLSEVNLSGKDLSETDFSKTDLSRANLSKTDLTGANLTGANLTGANLSQTSLVETNFTQAILTDCRIYGIAAWNVQLDGARQDNLVITSYLEPDIMVDNLKIAQFIYLLLHNAEIRDVIDTIAKQAVLILGRFTAERKPVLEAIRIALRSKGYVPILFDFQKPDSQDLTGTVSTLANISRFIIADLTDPSCSPYEIGLIAPCMKPIKPLFQPSKAATHEFAMFQDLRKRYSWVLSVYRYKDQESLLASMQEKVIAPAEKTVQKLEKKKRR